MILKPPFDPQFRFNPRSDNMPLTHDDIIQSILGCASENSAFLVKLALSEEAPGILAVHVKHTEILRNEVEAQREALGKLEHEIEVKAKLRRKYGDGSIRKYYYRATNMGPKWDAKAAKAQEEYFEVLAIKSKAEERRDVFRQDLDAAERAEPALLKEAQEHGKVHASIDGLYHSLFDGPTPGFDREDNLELRFYDARKAHEASKAKTLASRTGNRQLSSISIRATRADRLLQIADVQARDSFLFFDEAYFSVDKTNAEIDAALAALQRHTEAYSQDGLVAIRKDLKRELEAIKSGKIASSRGPILSAITTAQAHLLKARTLFETLATLAKEWELSCRNTMNVTARSLEDTRQALLHTRMGIFEQVAGFGEAAPAYTECCDRADWSCELPPIEVGGDEVTEATALPSYEEVRGRRGHTHEVEQSVLVDPVQTVTTTSPSEISGSVVAVPEELPRATRERTSEPYLDRKLRAEMGSSIL